MIPQGGNIIYLPGEKPTIGMKAWEPGTNEWPTALTLNGKGGSIYSFRAYAKFEVPRIVWVSLSDAAPPVLFIDWARSLVGSVRSRFFILYLMLSGN